MHFLGDRKEQQTDYTNIDNPHFPETGNTNKHERGRSLLNI